MLEEKCLLFLPQSMFLSHRYKMSVKKTRCVRQQDKM